MRFWLLRRSCLTPPPPPVAAGEVFDLSTVDLTTVDLVWWFQRFSQKWSRDFSNAAHVRLWRGHLRSGWVQGGLSCTELSLRAEQGVPTLDVCCT